MSHSSGEIVMTSILGRDRDDVASPRLESSLILGVCEPEEEWVVFQPASAVVRVGELDELPSLTVDLHRRAYDL
jgi:hypothetical protein